MFRLDSDNRFRAEKLDELGWLDHSFGTRLTGHPQDSAQVASLRQIHSDTVLFANQPGVVGQGDALVADRAGLTLAIRTADCLPVLMADVQNRAVAAVHAGWRGVVQEIVPKTVAAMAARFGTSAEELLIAMGPGIGPCCFEVGPEVSIQFSAFFPERDDLFTRAKVNLVETVVRQLTRIGIQRQQIATSGLCTCCGRELFHSYRRDNDAAGRMVTVIGIRRG